MTETNDKYRDIINLPHHVSKERKHMSLYDRAAQFAPFAALTGFDEDIEEEERITDSRIEAAEDELVRLNERFSDFLSRLNDQPEVVINVFEPDDKKEGGKVKEVRGRIKRFDDRERMLCFTDGRRVSLDDITDIKDDFDL